MITNIQGVGWTYGVSKQNERYPDVITDLRMWLRWWFLHWILCSMLNETIINVSHIFYKRCAYVHNVFLSVSQVLRMVVNCISINTIRKKKQNTNFDQKWYLTFMHCKKSTSFLSRYVDQVKKTEYIKLTIGTKKM